MLLFVSINSMQFLEILHYTLGHSNLVKRIALLLFPYHFPHHFTLSYMLSELRHNHQSQHSITVG